MAVVVGLRIPRKTGQLMVNIPAFCRDSVFDGVSEVEVEVSEDSKGKFARLRPVG